MFDQPYGYDPYNGYVQQPMMRQRPMPGPQRDPWTIVQTLSQVEQIAVQPGQVAWIMVQNEPVFARREADKMGLITTEYCRFERFDPKAAAAEPQAHDYVTREEFERFVAEIKKEWEELTE